jgi:hypothetical protein
MDRVRVIVCFATRNRVTGYWVRYRVKLESDTESIPPDRLDSLERVWLLAACEATRGYPTSRTNRRIGYEVTKRAGNPPLGADQEPAGLRTWRVFNPVY